MIWSTLVKSEIREEDLELEAKLSIIELSCSTLEQSLKSAEPIDLILAHTILCIKINLIGNNIFLWKNNNKIRKNILQFIYIN